MEEELLALPNLNLLYAKHKLRELRLSRILRYVDENKDHKLTKEFGNMLIAQAKELLADANREILEAQDKIAAICIEQDKKLLDK